MSKSIFHEKATARSFKRNPELLLQYINQCIADAIAENSTAPLTTIPGYLKECGYSNLFGLMDDLHYFN